MKTLQKEMLAAILSPRPRASHKGDFGHVLVVGGCPGFGGAVRMAAEAALRVGSGLVSVATHPRHADMLALARPEMMSHAITCAEDLILLLEKATLVVLGPGLGRLAWSRMVWDAVIGIKLPCVVDADGLNWLADFPQARPDWVLTPHPGEAARLLGISTLEVQQDRVAAVKLLQSRFGGWVVLKGAGTLIAGPNELLFLCEAGNPGMASGGMGDVLTGVIGGLMAQHIALDQAVPMGVLLHALAGDAAAAVSGERGLLAMDLVNYLQPLVNIR